MSKDLKMFWDTIKKQGSKKVQFSFTLFVSKGLPRSAGDSNLPTIVWISFRKLYQEIWKCSECAEKWKRRKLQYLTKVVLKMQFSSRYSEISCTGDI